MASEIGANLFDGRDSLMAEYLRLVREALPAAAKTAHPPWPIRLDHCFMRVVLDDVFGRPWRDVLDGRRPAYRQLSAEQLTRAVATARSMLDGGIARVVELNDASRSCRGHTPPTGVAAETAIDGG